LTPTRSLRLPYVAPLSLLFFYPFSYLWLTLFAILFTPFIIAISGLVGGIPPRDQEDFAWTSATFLVFGLCAAVYCGIQALAIN
jgi:hypothetical protein